MPPAMPPAIGFGAEPVYSGAMQRGLIAFLSLAFLGAASLLTLPCSAEPMTIKQPGNHPDYGFELEPHLLLGVGAPGRVRGGGFGLGVRGSIPIVDNGFVPTINNSVAISFGLDWVRYSGYEYGYRGCYNNKGNGNFCPYYDDSVTHVWIPVTLQWNFWLSQHWSVMGELGPSLRYTSGYYGDSGFGLDNPLALYVGGRWHFSDRAALTLRLGFPTSSVGVSFLL